MTWMSVKTQQGFNLHELMIVLLIITVLSVMSFSLLGPTFIEKSRSRAAATDLYRFLQFARSYAVFHGKTITLCASFDGQQCLASRDWRNANLLLYIDSNNNLRRDPDEEIIRHLNIVQYKGQLAWRSFGNKTYLQWHTNGMTYFQNGHFLFCPNNQKAQHAFVLVLNAAGRLYFTEDKNKDGIVEGSDGINVHCP